MLKRIGLAIIALGITYGALSTTAKPKHKRITSNDLVAVINQEHRPGVVCITSYVENTTNEEYISEHPSLPATGSNIGVVVKDYSGFIARGQSNQKARVTKFYQLEGNYQGNLELSIQGTGPTTDSARANALREVTLRHQPRSLTKVSVEFIARYKEIMSEAVGGGYRSTLQVLFRK